MHPAQKVLWMGFASKGFGARSKAVSFVFRSPWKQEPNVFETNRLGSKNKM